MPRSARRLASSSRLNRLEDSVAAVVAECATPAEPSPKFDAATAQTYPPTARFYDFGTLRTLFLDFETADWSDELVAFNDTDVEVPATLRVDGQTYRDVGIRTRGASSFMMVPKDRKLSLNVTIDFVHGSQNIQGYQTLNLLNANGDPTYLRGVLYLQAAREYLPAPEANYVRVVMNGENRGVYVNVEQVNRPFLERWYKTSGGARWKVPGSPVAAAASNTSATMSARIAASSTSGRRTIRRRGRRSST